MNTSFCLRTITTVVLTISALASTANAIITPISRGRFVNVNNPNVSTGGSLTISDSGSGVGSVFNETAQVMSDPFLPPFLLVASQRSEITSNFISASGRLAALGTPQFDLDYRSWTSFSVVFDVAVNTPYTLQLRTTSTPGTVTDIVSELVLSRQTPSQIGYVSYGIDPNSNLTDSGILLPGRHTLSFSFFFLNQPPSTQIPDSRGDTTYSFTLLVPAPTAAAPLAVLGLLAFRRRR